MHEYSEVIILVIVVASAGLLSLVMKHASCLSASVARLRNHEAKVVAGQILPSPMNRSLIRVIPVRFLIEISKK